MSREKDQFKFNTGTIGYPLLFVLVIWIVFWFEVRFGFNFKDFGVYPRTISGLKGVVFSPLIHSDIVHLWNNTLPLLILSAALFYFYQPNVWKIFIIGTLCTGLATWFMGREANHIGASGVVYMLFGFLFFKGILAKHFRLIALSFIVVFLYGSMMWYIFPIDSKISWEGHLSGLVVGTLLAIFIKRGVVKPKQYYWESPDYDPEEDEFLKHFDENGNFIENLPPKAVEDEEGIKIVYDYKEDNRGSVQE